MTVWVHFVVGGAVPLALLLGYNASCFGSPWVLSYAREAYGEYAALVGKGLIVHRDPDDYKTQPTGNAGPRLACAVIRRS